MQPSHKGLQKGLLFLVIRKIIINIHIICYIINNQTCSLIHDKENEIKQIKMHYKYRKRWENNKNEEGDRALRMSTWWCAATHTLELVKHSIQIIFPIGSYMFIMSTVYFTSGLWKAFRFRQRSARAVDARVAGVLGSRGSCGVPARSCPAIAIASSKCAMSSFFAHSCLPGLL